MTQPQTDQTTDQPTEDRPTRAAADLHQSTWIFDDRYAPHPVKVDYVSHPYPVADPLSVFTGVDSTVSMVTIVLFHHGMPAAYNVPAADPVQLATEAEIENQVEITRRETISDTLARLSKLVLDPRVPVDPTGILIDMGTTDRVGLHHLAGVIGADTRASYKNSRTGLTRHEINIGSLADNGLQAQWIADWKLDSDVAAEVDTHPCANGCSDPAAHAEGAHDL